MELGQGDNKQNVQRSQLCFLALSHQVHLFSKLRYCVESSKASKLQMAYNVNCEFSPDQHSLAAFGFRVMLGQPVNKVVDFWS
jgi:hypothetical protein